MTDLLAELHDVLDRHRATIVICDVNPEYIIVSLCDNSRTEEVRFLDSIWSEAITKKEYEYVRTA